MRYIRYRRYGRRRKLLAASELLIATSHVVRGGILNVVADLHRGLIANGVNSYIVGIGSEDACASIPKLTGISPQAVWPDNLEKVSLWSLRKWLTWIRFWTATPRVPVILHVSNVSGVSPVEVLLIRATGRAVVLSLHHPTDSVPRHGLRRLFVILALLGSSSVIVTSSYLRSELRQRWGFKGKIWVVNPGITPPKKLSRTKARKELGIDDDKFVVGHIGRLDPRKGLATLALAIREAWPESNSPYLLAAGAYDVAGDQLLQVVRDALPTQSQIIVNASDITPVFSAIDVLALPSLNEGFGLVILEAAFCQVPSVAYAVYGTATAIKDNETGILCERGDVGSVVSSIQAFRNDAKRLKAMGIAAGKRAKRRFTAEVMARRYSRVVYVSCG